MNVEATENVDDTQDESQDDDFVAETQEEENGISPPPTSGKRLARPVERSGKKAKCLPFVILICASPMWLPVNRVLCMTQVYCIMHWKQM